MRRRALLVAPVGLLAGCGFELKRPPELRFRTIQLRGFPTRSPLAAELKMQIDTSSGTRVVEAGQDAQVVLQALAEEREKSVVAQTAASGERAGKPRSWMVRKRSSGARFISKPQPASAASAASGKATRARRRIRRRR